MKENKPNVDVEYFNIKKLHTIQISLIVYYF